ncbi:MAG: outer membrane protein assembly factor BamD [Epsilonproteobacteria bacterium]|nr:outer membrane protein assembly factor BamD [Campylobacterota bacterium]
MGVFVKRCIFLIFFVVVCANAKDYFQYVSKIEWYGNNERFSLVYDKRNDLVWALQSAYIDYVKKNRPKEIVKDTLKVKEIRNSSREIYSCKIDTILYAGNYRDDNSKHWRFKDDNTLKICYKAEKGRSQVEKYGKMSALTINDMTNSWTFPKADTLLRNNPFKKYQKYFQLTNILWHNKFSRYNVPVIIFAKRYGRRAGGAFLYLYNKQTKLYDGKAFYSMEHSDCYRVGLRDGDIIYSLKIPILIRKPNAKYDDIIFKSGYSPEKKLSLLTSKLTSEALKVSKKSITKPKKIPHIKPKKLVKGEFEKSKDFKKRVLEYQAKIERENRLIDEKNKTNLQKYQEELKKEEANYRQKTSLFSNASQIAKTANLMAGKAMRMIFGDPKFSDIRYDADKEVFNATLYSSSNGFEKKIVIPVPIKRAKKFKEDILNDKLIPSVTFLVKNGKLYFDSVKIISNDAKIKKALELAKNIDTPKAYKEFIKEYPSGKYTKEAKRLLKDTLIRDSYQRASSIEELEKFIKRYPNSKYTKKAKNKIKKIKAKKAKQAKKREKLLSLYRAKKHIGDTVCKDGTTALVLNITIKAFVEGVSGDRIKLRISDTEGTTPYYNGVRLYKGSIIWDKYDNWYRCK